MKKNLKELICRFHFELYLGLSFLTSVFVFTIHPHFETFVSLSVYATFSVLYFWFYKLQFPMVITTIFVLFFFRVVLFINIIDCESQEVQFYLLVFILLIVGALFFFKFYFKKTKTYSECSGFLKKLKSDEVLLDTYFRDSLEHFGASKDKMLFLFIVTNGVCFLNDTSVPYLLSFLTSVYKGTALTFFLVLFLEAFFVITLEFYVLFQCQSQISNAILFGLQRVAKYVFVWVETLTHQ